jgi:hypothetical protein
MSLALILSLLSGIVPLFQKYLGTGLTNIIQTGITAIGTLISQWIKGKPVTDIVASLTALQTVLSSLQADAATDPADLPQIEELVKIIQAGIEGYQEAADGADPGTLPVPPPV